MYLMQIPCSFIRLIRVEYGDFPEDEIQFGLGVETLKIMEGCEAERADCSWKDFAFDH